MTSLEFHKEVVEWLLKTDIISLKEIGSNTSLSHTCRLTIGGSSCFENGLYVARIIERMRKNDDSAGNEMAQDLGDLQVGNAATVKLSNWNKVLPELMVMGIEVDSDSKALMVAGDSNIVVDIVNRLYVKAGHTITPVVKKPKVPDFTLDHKPPPPNAYRATVNGAGHRLDSSSTYDPDDGTLRGTSLTLGGKGSNPAAAVQSFVDGAPEPTGKPGHLLRNGPVDSSGNELNGNYLQGMTTPLDFLAATLSRSLAIPSTKAHMLIEQNSSDLYHLITTASDRFDDPILAWVQDMFSKHTVLIHFLNGNERQMRQTLAVLRNGLLSLSSEVCIWTSRLLSQVTESFKHSRSMMESAWVWFVEKENSGLEAVISCLRRHPHTKRALYTLLEAFCAPNRWYSLFSNFLKIFVSDPCDYMSFVMDFIEPIANSYLSTSGSASGHSINANGVIYYLTDFALTNSEIAGLEVWRISAVQMATELWIHFPSLLQNPPARANATLLALQDAVQDPCLELQIVGTLCSFRLLDMFIKNRSSYAPAVYRLLANLLGTTQTQGPLKDLLLSNFILTIRQCPGLPVGVLIEPLIKHMSSYMYCNQEYELILEFVHHGTLSHPHALLLLHLLGHISCTDPTYGRLASVPFLLLCDRYRASEEVIRFIGEFCMRIGNAYLNLQTMKSREEKQNASAGLSKDPNEPASDDELCQLLVVELLSKIVDLNINAYNKKVVKVVRGVIDKYQKMFHEESCDLVHVLNFFHELPQAGESALLANMAAPKLSLSRLHPPAVIAPVADHAPRVGFAKRHQRGGSARRSPHSLANIGQAQPTASTIHLDDDIMGPYGQRDLLKDKSTSYGDLMEQVIGAVDEKFFKAPRVGGNRDLPPPKVKADGRAARGRGKVKLGRVSAPTTTASPNGTAARKGAPTAARESPVKKKQQPRAKIDPAQKERRKQQHQKELKQARIRFADQRELDKEREEKEKTAKLDVTEAAYKKQVRLELPAEHEDPNDAALRQARTMLQRSKAQREREAKEAELAAQQVQERKERLQAARAEIEKVRLEELRNQARQSEERAAREQKLAKQRVAEYRARNLDDSMEKELKLVEAAKEEKDKRKRKMAEFLARQKQRERTMRERQKNGIGVVKAVLEEQEQGKPRKTQPVHSPSPSPSPSKTQPRTEPTAVSDAGQDDGDVEAAQGTSGDTGTQGEGGSNEITNDDTDAAAAATTTTTTAESTEDAREAEGKEEEEKEEDEEEDAESVYESAYESDATDDG